MSWIVTGFPSGSVTLRAAVRRVRGRALECDARQVDGDDRPSVRSQPDSIRAFADPGVERAACGEPTEPTASQS